MFGVTKGYVPAMQMRYRKEVFEMDNCKANRSIECTVQQCANHCQNANYCSLNCVRIGTHENSPSMDQCTDCKSFMRR